MSEKTLKLGNTESVENYRGRVSVDIAEHGKTYGKVAADCRELAAAIVAASTHATGEQKSHLASLLNTIDSAYDTAGMVWDSFRTMLRKQTKDSGIVLDVYPVRGASIGSRYLAKQIKLSGVAATATVEPVEPIASENTAGNSQQDVSATAAATGKHGIELAETVISQLIKNKDVTAAQLLALAASRMPVDQLDKAVSLLGYVPLDTASEMVDAAIEAERAAIAKRSASRTPAKRKATAKRKTA